MRTMVFLMLCLGLCHGGTNAAQKKAQAPVVITAPANLERCGDWICLTIADASHSYNLRWGMPPHYPGLVALETNRVYTFTIVEEPFMPDIPIPKVVRVERDGKVIYDREVCQVHHIKMHRKEVPIVYGLFRPRSDEPSGATERQLFPHRQEVVLGGCCVSPVKTDKIFICSDCKKAYEKWKTENPEKK